MKKPLYLCAILATTLLADGDDLYKLFEEATKIATKTKLNIDYVPGTVTIVHGEELKALGITNLGQRNALDMIVGMETVASSLRGVGSMYGANGNKIKWMINDKVIETETRETDNWAKGPVVIPLPVDFIDRIEVIRGPGSAIYGGNAIFGVINIVTRKNASGAFVTGEGFGGGRSGIGAGAYMNFKRDDLSIDASLSTFKSDGQDLYVANYGHFYNEINAKQTPGYGPGNLAVNSRGHTAMIDADYKGYKAWLYRFETRLGQGFDWIPTNTLSPDGDNYCKTSKITTAGVQKTFEPIEDLTVTPQVGVSIYENPADNFIYFPSELFKIWPQAKYNNDGILSREYREQKDFLQLDFTYKLDYHTITTGVFAQNTRVLEDTVSRNFKIPDGIVDFFTHKPQIRGNNKRIQKAIFLQDEWDVNEDTTITAGARYDHFSDVGVALSPRLAAVYRMNDSNILKFQYSRAFRAPSLFEDYGYMTPTPLRPEFVDTAEVGYIYKNSRETFKATIFMSQILDMITQNYQSYYFENTKQKTKVKGAELEYKWHGENFNTGFNTAFYNTRSDFTENQLSLTSNFMGNAFLTIAPNTNYPLNIWYRYIYKKPRLENYSNGFVEAQDTLNITQKIKGVVKNLEIDLGIQNLFNKTQTMLVMPLNPPNSEDIPYARQSFWLNAHYRF